MGTDRVSKSLWHRGGRSAVLILPFTLFCLGCNSIPSGISTAPKEIEADHAAYVACEGFVIVYHPSRDIADSSSKTYEITFTDDYGKSQDLKDISVYTIREPAVGQALNYAMPSVASPSNTSTTYSNGQPIPMGGVVMFGNYGDQGRAIWLGPGKWKPVPCGFTGS